MRCSAAGLLAVLPLHVRYSHYVLTDTLQTFFVTLTFLLSLVAHERNTRARLRGGGRGSRAGGRDEIQRRHRGDDAAARLLDDAAGAVLAA